MTDWKQGVQAKADGIRHRVLDHVVANGGGYMSQACSAAELFSVLYGHTMKLGDSVAPMIPDPFPGVPSKKNTEYKTGAGYNGPKSPELDRFFLSPSHYALVHYAALVEAGRMAPEGLKMFNQDGQSVEMIAAEHSPGSEVMGGSLGQALSQACGVAYARRIKGDSGRVFVLMSDGEFQEGQTWEAFQVSAFQELDNLLVYVDVNGQQVDGTTEDVMRIEPLASRLEAFGAQVFSVDGHDLDALDAPARLEPNGMPTVVLGYTDPCRGLPLLEDRRPFLHYLRFKSEEEKQSYADALAAMTEGMS